MTYNRISSFNPKCSSCALGCGKAVAGQSISNFADVALVIIGGFPSSQDIAQGLSMAPGGDKKKKTNSMTPGEFLRVALASMFDADPNFPKELKPFEKYCYLTNALKCSNQRGQVKINITPGHIKACREQWLSKELMQVNPHTPILLAAPEAVKSLLGPDEGLYGSRRKVHRIGQHPAITTFTLAEAERGLIKTIPNEEVVEEELTRLFARVRNPGKKLDTLMKVEYWKPAPVGSMSWHFRRDMDLIKELVIDYYQTHITQGNPF